MMTPRIREEIQKSQESQRVLAKKFGINIKTVKYWKNANVAFYKQIPTLLRSNWHRLFVKNSISKLPKEATEIDKKKITQKNFVFF